MGRLLALFGALAVVFGVAVWYYQPPSAPAAPVTRVDDNTWIDRLYSQNPKESEDAAEYVAHIGDRAVPVIRTTLQNRSAERSRRKAALKACVILGLAAVPAIPEVAAALTEPDLTSEAAVALSFMGRGAFEPLQRALTSDDPAVRRESLRSIGKLEERAPLEGDTVVPLLVDAMADEDAGVRTVAATYLGIIHEGGADAVAVLVDGLKDPEPLVRRASAAALASFGPEAQSALSALRRAAVDQDPDVAREAGVTLVKLQPR